LIQLYCAQLLSHLTNPNYSGFDVKTSPPVQITSTNISEVYRDKTFREDIRKRFNWTLELDDRYEVIAYAIALQTLHNDTSLTNAFTIEDIRSEALVWWADGFKDSSSIDTFRSLVEEMVGLGILQPVANNLYALRSPNVLSLLGDKDNVERVLLRQREPPVEYVSNTFRASIRSSDGLEHNIDVARRSPLTSQQESLIRQHDNGVTVVYGCEAAGINEVEPYLRSVLGPDNLVRVDSTSNIAELRKYFERLAQRDRSEVTVLWVPGSIPWTTSWILESLTQVKRYRSHHAIVRVVFAATPNTCWQLICQEHAELQQCREEGLTEVGLQPWHDSALRQWLEDNGLGPREPDGRELVRLYTGNWSNLLQEYYSLCTRQKLEPIDALDRIDRLLSSDHKDRFLRAFGLPSSTIRRRVLTELGKSEPAAAGDLAGKLPDANEHLIHCILQWADRLNLITSIGRQYWHVNSAVRKALIAASE
jgi:hypothetical protein